MRMENGECQDWSRRCSFQCMGLIRVKRQQHQIWMIGVKYRKDNLCVPLNMKDTVCKRIYTCTMWKLAEWSKVEKFTCWTEANKKPLFQKCH